MGSGSHEGLEPTYQVQTSEHGGTWSWRILEPHRGAPEILRESHGYVTESEARSAAEQYLRAVYGRTERQWG